MAHGKYLVRAICCYDSKLTPPCGACLQYMLLFSQLSGHDVEIIMADDTGAVTRSTVSKLLPKGYQTHNNLSLIRSYAKRR